MTEPDVVPQPLFASCPDCPGWQVLSDNDVDKATKEHRHDQRHHTGREPRPIPTVEPAAHATSSVLASHAHWAAAIDAIADQAAGSRFTIYEVCKDLPEPPKGWASLAKDAEHIGLIRKIGGTESKRPGTKGSMTGLWQRTAHNPDRNRARRTA